MFYLEVQKYKELSHTHSDEEILKKKCQAIVDCFLESAIQPSCQVSFFLVLLTLMVRLLTFLVRLLTFVVRLLTPMVQLLTSMVQLLTTTDGLLTFMVRLLTFTDGLLTFLVMLLTFMVRRLTFMVQLLTFSPLKSASPWYSAGFSCDLLWFIEGHSVFI